MQKELKRLNAQITRLTPAILAGPAKEHISIKLSRALLSSCHQGVVPIHGIILEDFNN
jgi:hypothetical protein